MYNEGIFSAAGTNQLFYRSWQPTGTPRAVVAVAHGVLEHSGRYDNLVDGLVPHGYAVYAYDHQGHGRSPGRRAWIANFADFRADLGAFMAMVREREPGRPLFLLGHSMGGLIVLDYILNSQDRPTGVVVSGAAVTTGTPPAVAVLAPILARLLGGLGLPAKKGAAATISRDPAVVQAYLDDPLVPDNLTVQLGAEIIKTASANLTRGCDWPPALPLLMLHGADDKIVPPAGSRRFFAELPTKTNTRHEYPNGYHEVFNDLDKEQVLDDLRQWLEERL